MKKILPLLALVLLFSAGSFGQIGFEKGYFISDNGSRTECFIRNTDWLYNPTHFQYQETEGGTPQDADIEHVKEFAIDGKYGYVHFVRFRVRIDTAFEKSYNVTYNRNPEYGEKTVFLRVVYEGAASLYAYNQVSRKSYFYAQADSLPQLLVYKKYRTTQGVQAANNAFRGQLWNSVKCPGAELRSIERLAYTEKDLVAYFQEYNRCKGGKEPAVAAVANKTNANTNIRKKASRKFFNLRVTPGVDFVSLKDDPYHVAYKRSAAFRMGVEAEFILPVNMNKWGIVIEPVFQQAEVNSKSAQNGAAGLNASYSYSGIELAFGGRYYFFLNKKTRLFVDAFGIFPADLKFTSEVEYARPGDIHTMETTYETNFDYALGAGVSISRISAEFRYYGNKALLYKYTTDLYGNYSRFSFIAGIRLW